MGLSELKPPPVQELMDAVGITPIQEYPERAVPRPENNMRTGGHENRDGEVLLGRLEIPFTENEVNAGGRLADVANPVSEIE